MTATSQLPTGFREFIQEHSERLFQFSALMLPKDTAVEEFVLDVLREFAREGVKLNHNSTEPLELRVRLFRLAWDELRDTLTGIPQTSWAGRDTRGMKDLESDLLEGWRAAKGKKNGEAAQIEQAILVRLRRVDADLRAPVVLRDILGFTDEEAASMLAVRWGVFRHRLHRGRLELCEVLKAQAVALDRTPTRSVEAPQW